MTGTIVQKYINALYVVMYDRAADSNGYNYWLSTVGGASAAQTPITDAIAQTMAGSFRTASSSYFNTQYAALSDSDFILELYENLGGNSSGVGGDALNYWQGRLDSFGGDRAKLAGDITKAFLEYNGTDADGLLRKQAFENKVAVSQAWVDASRTNAFMNAAATTDPAFAAETRVLNGIDHTTASLNLALAQVNAVVVTRDLARATGLDPAPSTPTYALAAGATSVNEGATATFTLTTTNVAAGSEFAYTLSGVSAADVVGGALSGMVTIGADGTAVIQVQLVADASVLEGAETLSVSVAGVTASTTVNDTSSAVGQVFTLTTGIDAFNGGGGADTFNAYDLDQVSNTLGSTDVLNGGSGTDTLDVYVPVAVDNLTPSLTAIENINVTADGTTVLNMSQSTGYTTLANVNSSRGVTFNNINSTSVALKVQDNGNQATTFAFATEAVAGSADAATLTLDNVVSSPVTIAGVETLNIVSTGSANSAALTTANATSYVVTGDQSLNLGTVGVSVATINASAMTGALTATGAFATGTNITGGSGADVLTGAGANDTISGGAGNDNIIAGAGNDNINGGAGDDRVTFATATNLTTNDTVAGGDGTDTLVATSADMTGGPYTRISGFERLTVSDALGANLTTANVQAGIETVTLEAALGTGRSITMEAGSRTVTQTATQAAALTVNDTGSATTDTLTLNIASTVGAVDVLSNEIIVGGFETVNIVTTTTAAATQAMDAITVTSDSSLAAVTINFSGNNSVTTGVITATNAASGTVNASGMTGTATFTNVGATVGITSITGTANNDTIVGSATSTTIDGGAGRDNITGGAGNDVVTGGAGNDTVNGADGNDLIDGGAGNDSITSGTGNDTVLGGEGNDTIIFGDNLTTGDSIDGGDGTDTLSVTGTTLSALNALTLSQVVALNGRISNVERVTISNVLNQGTFDVARIDGISTITLADGISGDETLTGLASGSTVIATADNVADTDILTLSLTDNTGSSDVINYTMTQAASDDYGVLSVAGIETVNITINEDPASSTGYVGTLGLSVSRTDGSTTRAVTVNISGTEGLTVDTAINADVIDASGLTGAFTMSDATGSSLAQTITGGSGADSLVGGNGIDVISGGSGADSIFGGDGNDNLTGGNGADVITGGGGVDTITLTESIPSSDTVVFDFVSGGADVITGFATGATNGDVLRVDISAIEDLSTSGGLFTSATDIVGLSDGDSDTDEGIQVMSASAAATAGANIFVLRGTINSTADLEDALEVGGAFEISGIDHPDVAANDIFFAVYTNGTDAFLAAVRVAVDVDTASFDTGDLVATNIAQLIGVSTIGASTFVAGNFDLIA